MMASAGIFYSLMVLSLLAPIVLYILSYMNAVQTQGEQMTVKFEGIELANYADSIALDVPRVLEIGSKRAIVAAINQIDTQGTALNDSEYEIKYLILHNTFSNGTASDIMLNSSFENWINATANIGANHGFVANLTVLSLTLKHYDPFTLNLTITIAANITDRFGAMNLTRNYTGESLVSIEGFVDPIYPLNTRGLIERTVRRANRTINDTASVAQMIQYGWYVNNSDAPSFLERLQNCTMPVQGAYNCSGRYPGMGIESFVDFFELSGSLQSSPQLLKANSSMVDHMYFNHTFVPGCNVSGVTSFLTPPDPVTGIVPVSNSPNNWFRLDSPIAALPGAHNTTYKVAINCS